MTCTKTGCPREGDDLEESKLGGITIIACRDHQTAIRLDVNIHQLFRNQQRGARQLAILIDALKGPAADPDRCLRNLDGLMDAEVALQEAVEGWLSTAGSDRPS